jgi:hypothetical protein
MRPDYGFFISDFYLVFRVGTCPSTSSSFVSSCPMCEEFLFFMFHGIKFETFSLEAGIHIPDFDGKIPRGGSAFRVIRSAYMACGCLFLKKMLWFSLKDQMPHYPKDCARCRRLPAPRGTDCA